MDPVTERLHKLDRDVDKLADQANDFRQAWFNATDEKQMADFKQVWQQLVTEKEKLMTERLEYCALHQGTGTLGPAPQFNSLEAIVRHLDGLGFAQPVEHRNKKAREQTFILDRGDVGDAVLNEMVRTITAAGSVDRKEGRLLTLETGSGVGKTYAASLIDVLMERAARARAAEQSGGEALQQLLHAFDEERVAVLNFDFNGGGDYIANKDVVPCTDPSVALGIRLAARGLFNVSTVTLRAKLRPLPAGVESLFAVDAVWPLVCRRLRMAHGLAADFSADPRPLILVSSFDEFQLIARDLQKDFGYSEPAARAFAKELQRSMAYLVLTEAGKRSPAAKQGVLFVPMLLGTCLCALEDYEVSQLTWVRGYLQPLSFSDSCRVFKREVLQRLQWPGPRESSEAFFVRLAGEARVLATLELAGGIPALLVEAATTFAEDEELSRCIRHMMRDDNLCETRLVSFTTLWISKWMERLRQRYRMDVIIKRICRNDRQHLPQVARRLLLLMLTGTPIREDQCICEASTATLGDALVSGAFYVRKAGTSSECKATGVQQGTSLIISMPAILLMLLKGTEGALDACSMGERTAISQLTPDTIIFRRGVDGAICEEVVRAHTVLAAACRMDLGSSTSEPCSGYIAAAWELLDTAAARGTC